MLILGLKELNVILHYMKGIEADKIGMVHPVRISSKSYLPSSCKMKLQLDYVTRNKKKIRIFR